jgi:hypothetical protein
VLTLAEVDVEGSASLTNLYSTLIQTNLLNEIQNQNSSVFIRIPFSVVDKSKYDFMYLNVRYDDGFAAYLNGSLVAIRNTPAGLAWNAVATAEHSKPAAILYETINLTPYVYLLNNGNNVLAIHGLNLTSGDEDFLMDVQLTANEANCGPVGYLGQMTPGQVNGSQSFEMVADTKFSINRGYYDEPFDVAISTDTAGATIYYTTDGSTPSSGHGNVYTAPIHIAKTTCLRAIAIKSGCLSTNVDTQTYIFLNDVIHQPENPEGFPTLWKSVAADYEMDPNIVDNPQYSAQMRDVLLSLPVISLVTDQGNLFDSTYGIYANSDQFAYDMADGTTKWEVPVSMEYFDPNSSKEIQVDCGLRIQGAYFRKAASTPKHSFRLLFKRDYGPAKLNFPFFDYDNDAANSFDTIILRAQGNDGYSWGSMGGKSQYVRDEFGRRVQMATGHASPHGTFVHLYINGLYWGLYNPTERPDSSFMASYYGGEKEDWDVFKHKLFELNEGTPDALNQMKALCQTSVAKGSVVITNAVYQQLQGNNPDGTRNPSYPDLLDMDNYIDYMLTNFWTGNQDWGFNDNNYWLGRLRVGDSTGFKFYCWDIEDTLDSPRSPLTFDNVNHVMSYDVTGMGLFHNRLVSNAEYRLSFADHAHKHLFNGGVMTMGPAVALYTPLANMVERAMIAESARWGNQHHTPSYTQANWITERDYILNTYFPQRTALVVGHLKAKGLYPNVEAPTFNINGTYQHGGNVGNPAALTMEVPEIITYVSTEFVPEGAAVRAYVPSDNSLGLTWTSQSFTPGTGWTTGSTGTGVGYDCSPSAPYDVLIHTDVESLMYNLRTSVYCRIAFNVSNPADVNDLKLQIKYDDGFIAYLNGTEVCRSSNITNAVPPTAAGSHEAGTTFVEFDITAYKTLLTTGTNILAIHGINSSKASKDLLVLPKLVASVRTVVFPPVWYTTDGTDPRQFGGAVSPSASLYSGAVTLTRSRCVKARTLSTSQWSALNEATYSVGPVAESLRITELMYHPEGDPNAEYIELKNIGTQTINLNLVRFTKGVDFTFGPLDLAAGGFIVVVRNTAAFNAAHPGFTGTVAGVYTGSLNSAGEKIRLKDAIGTVIHEFTYQDTWYDMTDGEGFSLTIKNPAAGDLTLWNQKAGWRPSAMSGGSPGLDDSGIIPALGSVVINEVLAHSPAGQPDWIEFYNTTDQAIYLGGWFLSDSNANDPNRMKYRIGEEVVIPAGGYYVFYEDQHFGNPADPGCNIPFALSEGGDSVYLFSGDGETLTGYVEEETFDASETDVAFGRYYKASTDSYNFVAMSENTPGSANAYPKVGPIVIREIMYNPPAGGIYDKEEYEYIELRNIESYSVALQEYDIVQDIYVPWKITDGVEFTFPLEVTIPAGGTMVVVRNVTAFSVRYPSVPTNKIYGPYSGKLDNAGEKVDLVKPGDEEAGVRYYIRVDRVNYSDGSHPVGSDPWPAQADGLGMSLTRINDSLYGNDVANWQAASPTPGQ